MAEVKPTTLHTRLIRGKEYVLCQWRKQFVRLTPEEYVRQSFLHYLVEERSYPKERIAVEVYLGGKRADAIVYNQQWQPVMLIEFKAETVALTQKVLDQISIYNRQLHVPFLILHNGPGSIIARVTEQQISFLDHIPDYGEII